MLAYYQPAVVVGVKLLQLSLIKLHLQSSAGVSFP